MTSVYNIKSIFYIANFCQPKVNKEYIHTFILSPVKFHLHSLGTVGLQRAEAATGGVL